MVFPERQVSPARRPGHGQAQVTHSDLVDLLACPSWCDAAACDLGSTDFNPDQPPRAHRSRLVSTSPGVRRQVEVSVQLVRFVDDDLPQPDMLRVQIGDVEGQQSFHVHLDQGEVLARVVRDLLDAYGRPRTVA